MYGEEKDLFRWTDGGYAFSRKHADWDWELLRKRGADQGLVIHSASKSDAEFKSGLEYAWQCPCFAGKAC